MNSIEDILRWLEINGLEFFKVSKSRGDKNDKVYETSSEDNPAERIRKFRDAMKFAPSGYFYITARRSQTATTGLFENEFMNGQAASPAVGGVAPAVSGDFVPKSEISGMVQAEMEKYKQEIRMKELEEENRELKQQVNSAMTGIGNALNKIMPVIADRIFPQRPAVQVAGIERSEQPTQQNEIDEIIDTEVVEATNEENERIQNALMKWSEADADFIQVLEFIADFAATGKTISPFPMVTLDYNSIKGMLK